MIPFSPQPSHEWQVSILLGILHHLPGPVYRIGLPHTCNFPCLSYTMCSLAFKIDPVSPQGSRCSNLFHTLMAWLSTSDCHTGSQKMTRDAEIRFLTYNFSVSPLPQALKEQIKKTYKPRAPCFSSIKNTLYVSDVSNVRTSCSR